MFEGYRNFELFAVCCNPDKNLHEISGFGSDEIDSFELPLRLFRILVHQLVSNHHKRLKRRCGRQGANALHEIGFIPVTHFRDGLLLQFADGFKNGILNIGDERSVSIQIRIYDLHISVSEPIQPFHAQWRDAETDCATYGIGKSVGDVRARLNCRRQDLRLRFIELRFGLSHVRALRIPERFRQSKAFHRVGHEDPRAHQALHPPPPKRQAHLEMSRSAPILEYQYHRRGQHRLRGSRKAATRHPHRNAFAKA